MCILIRASSHWDSDLKQPWGKHVLELSGDLARRDSRGINMLSSVFLPLVFCHGLSVAKLNQKPKGKGAPWCRPFRSAFLHTEQDGEYLWGVQLENHPNYLLQWKIGLLVPWFYVQLNRTNISSERNRYNRYMLWDVKRCINLRVYP